MAAAVLIATESVVETAGRMCCLGHHVEEFKYREWTTVDPGRYAKGVRQCFQYYIHYILAASRDLEIIHSCIRIRWTAPRPKSPRVLAKEMVLRFNIFAEQLWRKSSHQWPDTGVQRQRANSELLFELHKFVSSSVEPFSHLHFLNRGTT